MSSFARGTNTDLTPDMDIIFFNAPRDESQGYKDWTSIGTRELTGNKEGITSLDELNQYDPLLAKMIPRIQRALDAYFGQPTGRTQFNYLRTWVGYPGIVSNLSLPHPEYQEIRFDIDLDYASTHYGVIHSQRFEHYFERLVTTSGPQAAVQLIEDIKKLKQQGKDKARDNKGWIDRTKKLAGFVIEGLFLQRFPPYSYAELMEMIIAHQWQPGQEPTEHWIGDQRDQIIDAGFSFSALLHNMAHENESLPLGAWQNLLSIAEEYFAGIAE
jgi:hypothetical protein